MNKNDRRRHTHHTRVRVRSTSTPACGCGTTEGGDIAILPPRVHEHKRTHYIYLPACVCALRTINISLNRIHPQRVETKKAQHTHKS